MHRYFFFLLLLMLPTQLGYHFWPEWALVLGRRVDYLSPTIYFTDILLALTVGSWMVKKWRSVEAAKRRLSLGKLGRLGVLGVFVAANIFFAASPFVALYKWVKVFEFFLLGYYILTTKPTLSSITFPLSIAVLYSSIIAIAQFLLQHSVGGPLWWLGERTFDVSSPGIARVQLGGEMLRAYGTFPHPNVLGGFLAAMMPLLIHKLTNSQINKLTWEKIFYGGTVLLGIIALGLTFSRSAIVVGIFTMTATIINLPGFRIKSGMTKRVGGMTARKLLFLGITAVMIAILFFLFPFSPSDESVVVRQQLNVVAIKQWLSSPVVGVGAGNFLVNLPAALPTRAIYFLQPVHNIYLQVLAEMGIIGFLLFAVFIIKSVGASKLRRVEEKRPRNLETSQPRNLVRLSLVVLLLLGLVDHYPLTLQQGQLLLSVFAGLTILQYNKKRL